jgi:hypothetical protein
MKIHGTTLGTARSAAIVNDTHAQKMPQKYRYDPAAGVRIERRNLIANCPAL